MMTCSSLMRCWSFSLRTGPLRPPLRGLMKTTMGVRGATAPFSSPSAPPTTRLSPAAGSWSRMLSRIAWRRYLGIVRFCLSSSLSMRIPARPHTRNESTIVDVLCGVLPASPVVDDGEFIMLKLSSPSASFSLSPNRFMRNYAVRWTNVFKEIFCLIFFFNEFVK